MSISKKDLQMLQLQQQCQRNDLVGKYIESGHAKPTTRREFLNSGLIAMGGALLMPTLAQLIAQSAWADTISCSGGGANPLSTPAFINIQLSGGSANFANHVIRGNNGDPLSNYAALGMGFAPRVENLFANSAPFWINPGDAPGASGFALGLLNVVPRTNDIFNKTAFVAVAAESADDRRSNPGDLSGLLEAAGFIGSSLPYLLTGYGGPLSEAFVPGGNDFVGAILNSAIMLNVTSKSSIEGSLKVKGALGALPSGMPQKLVKAIEDLSKLQVESLANDPNSHESQKIYKEMMMCSNQKNTSILGTPKVVDIYSADFPTNQATNAAERVSEIWKQNKGTESTNADLSNLGFNFPLMNAVIERSGLAVANCMQGLSGAAIVSLGGYDYHSSLYNRRDAELKDKFFGDIVGRTLLTAKAFNRKVFIYVSADGSVNNSDTSSSDVNWNSDYAKRATNYILAYDPAGAPSTAGVTVGNYSDAPFQLNHFSAAQVVDPSNPISSLDAHDLCAAAVFLNFLNFAKKSDLIFSNAALAPVKKRLQDALPAGAGDIINYYTRIKS